jgi:nucleoside-diphosphate-sugar epimerase
MRFVCLGSGPIANAFYAHLEQQGVSHIAFGSKLSPDIKMMSYHEYLDLVPNRNDHLVVFWRFLPSGDYQSMTKDLLEKLSKDCEDFGSVNVLSSVAVYGSSNSARNEFSVERPINDYGIKKLLLESWFINLNPKNLRIFRISNVFGSSQFTDFLNLCLEFSLSKKKLLVTAPDLVSRDFIDINTLILILKESVYCNQFQEDHLNIINIASGQNFLLRKIISLFEEEAKFSLDYEIIEKPNNVIATSYVDNSKLLSNSKIQIPDQGEMISEYFRSYFQTKF